MDLNIKEKETPDRRPAPWHPKNLSGFEGDRFQQRNYATGLAENQKLGG
jgi:hypothetical protein